MCSTVTGQIVGDIPFIGTPSWSFGVDLDGSWGVTVRISDVGKAYLLSLLDMWRYSWGIAWGGMLMQCGPATAANIPDDANGTAQIAGTGIWGLLTAKRLVISSAWSPSTPVTDPVADVNIGPTSLHTIAKRLVLEDLSRTGHDLPIVLPDDIDGVNSRNYYGYELAPVGQRLHELTQVDGGPEVEFRPRWVDDNQTAVQWYMRIGNPSLGQLGYPHAFDYPKGVIQLPVSIDASLMTMAHFTKGAGTDRTMQVGYDTDPTLINAGWPALEDADANHTSATEQDTLDGWAAAYVSTYNAPVTVNNLIVRLDGTDGEGNPTGSPTLDLVSAGDNAQVTTKNHSLLPDGALGMRILSIENGSDATTAKLNVQEIR